MKDKTKEPGRSRDKNISRDKKIRTLRDSDLKTIRGGINALDIEPFLARTLKKGAK